MDYTSRFGTWITSVGTPPISVWPLGYHVQMALASLFTGDGQASGQLLSILAGYSSPRFGRRCFFLNYTPDAWRLDDPGTRRPVLKELPWRIDCSFSAIAMRSSLVVMSDMVALQWATLGTLLVVRYVKRGKRPSTLLLAGVCIGLASFTRYIYPLLLIPLVGYLAVSTERSAVPPSTHKYRTLVRELLLLLGPVAILVGLQVAHDVIHPMPTLPSPVLATWSSTHLLQGSFDGPDGHASYSNNMLYFYALWSLLSTQSVGYCMVPCILLGLAWIAARRAYASALLLAGWWPLFVAFYSGTIYQAGRFVLTYLPPLAIIAGYGIAYLVESVAARLDEGRLSRAVSLLAVFGIILLAVASTADFRQLVNDKEDYLHATSCLDSAVARQPTPLPVLSFAVTFTLKQYTNLDVRELYDESPVSVDAALRAPREGLRGYLVLPLSGFELSGATRRSDKHTIICGALTH